MTQTSTATRVPAPPDVRGMRVPERTLQLLRDLIAARTGLHHDDGRLDFLRDRLVPLALERGFDSLLDYYYLLKYDADSEKEWRRAVDAISVQETYFWREPDQLEALTGAILPALERLGRHHVRIWSLPCASGEEPLSIAMALMEAGWYSRMTIELHAGDASCAAITRARAGRYTGRAFRQLPPPLKERYFRRDPSSADAWLIDPDVQRRVLSWSVINVVDAAHVAPMADADVIFCRNLFIYFEASTVQQVVGAFANLMSSPGYLCVGAAESLLRLTTRFDLQELSGAYVYVKR